MAQVGSRVIARWSVEPDWFYPGVVCESNGSVCEVQFDDGDRGEVPVSDVKPIPNLENHRIFGNWRGGGIYYAGRVSSVEGHAIHIDFDDGDTETTSVSMLRFHRDDLH